MGTMVTSIYVLADTIIIGKGLGSVAMAALNIALPIYNVFFGLGLLFGVGGSVLMSIFRGRGEKEKADAYFTASFLLNILIWLLLLVVSVVFMEDIAWLLGGTEETMPYIMDYIPYIIWGMGAYFLSAFLQTFVRNDGAPKLAMNAVIAGGITNIVLDYVFGISYGNGNVRGCNRNGYRLLFNRRNSAYSFFYKEKSVEIQPSWYSCKLYEGYSGERNSQFFD